MAQELASLRSGEVRLDEVKNVDINVCRLGCVMRIARGLDESHYK